VPDWTLSLFLKHAHLFAIGIVFAQYKWIAPLPVVLSGIAAALIAPWLGASMMLGSMIWALALFSSLPHLQRSSILLRPVAWVGVVSYSLYIWHYLLISIVGPMWRSAVWDSMPWTRGILFLTLCFALSAASYWAIEWPGKSWLRLCLLGRFSKFAT
jgi:peptidoglycan/LPS O-acetylase OafA/YrhL